jgi:16S rRNA (guanine527-N7)-methyltransferase
MRLVVTAGPGTGAAGGADAVPSGAGAAAPSGAEAVPSGAGDVLPRPGAVPPPAAREIFGPAFPLARRYADMLATAGVIRGLIGPREASRLWDRHLLNCAVVADLVPRPATLLDIGSGAGLPGIVLAMLLPDVQVTLLEPMARRVAFLNECRAGLGLRNVTVQRARAEDVRGQVRADVVTARAVAPLDRLAGLAMPLVRPGGMVLALKGERAAAEADAAGPVLRRLGAGEITVLRAGVGKISPAATVVRLTAGAGPTAGTGRRPRRRSAPRGSRANPAGGSG